MGEKNGKEKIGSKKNVGEKKEIERKVAVKKRVCKKSGGVKSTKILVVGVKKVRVKSG